MTNVQLYLAIGVPLLFNALMFGFLYSHTNTRFDALDRRFDEALDFWRAELTHFEERIGARLKRLEEL
jgi:hypothetical protein